jgi:dihydroorotate dehydrogenase electron transfer subunit
LKPDFQWVEVTGIEHLAEDTYALSYNRPDIASHIGAGQFCMVSPRPGTSNVFLPRPFSYYKADSSGKIELLFRTFGKATRWMAGLRPGDSIGEFGPLGNAFTLPENARRAILVGGGIGLPPMVMLAGALAAEGIEVDLVYGEMTGARVVDLKQVVPGGVRVHVATEDGAVGHCGLVTEIFAPMFSKCTEPPAVYSCGPNQMMASLAAMIKPEKVALFQTSCEEYMACGNGICQGCVIPVWSGDETVYLRCCTEGPVFNGFEVAWTLT